MGKICLSVHLETCEKSIYGAPNEKPKVVLPANSKSYLLKLAVHVAPMGATITLLYFNITGYFVGSTLAGLVSATAQSIDRLALQVTAKLYEVLVIMSLGVIIADEVRERLLFGSGGLPLGLLQSHNQFSDIAFLKSRAFRAGTAGIIERRERILFGLLIVACSLVALFIGPSSAVLVIPTWHTDWPAGGATFWLNGDLNPTQLNNASVQNPQCFAYETNSSVLDSMDWTYASCPWAGYPYLKRYFEVPSIGASHHVAYNYRTFVQDLAVQWADGIDTVYAIDFLRTWAVASNIAIAAFSRHIANMNWPRALYSPAVSGSVRSRWIFGQANGTTGVVGGRVPVVRTQCFVAKWHTQGMPADTSTDEQLMPFPVILDLSGRKERAYFIPVPVLNVSYPATQWVEPPSFPTTTNEGFTISNYPSAFLVIRNPTFYSDMTCSIQADWVPGSHVTSLVKYEIMTNQHATLGTEDLSRLQRWTDDPWNPAGGARGPPPEFEKPATWQHISLSTSWLSVLTPAIDPERQGWTTMASVLDTVLGQVEPPQFAPYAVAYPSVIFEQVTAVVASFVADALSRFGWDENYAYNLTSDTVFNIETSSNSSTPGWNYGRSNWLDIFTEILHGKASLQPNNIYREENGQNYTIRVGLEGYGMSINGLAYELAMVVLSVYICLVVYHVYFVLRRDRKSHGSGRWSSVIDMLVLAQVSNPPSHALMNTCAGVDAHATLKLPVSIRHVSTDKPGGEKVQLLVNSNAGRKIEVKEKYGACDNQQLKPLIQALTI